MIYLVNFSNEEKKAIEVFHTCIINDLPKDMLPMLEDAALLYRFLKARDFDVDKAEKMLRRHIRWRRHFQIETILEDFTPKPYFENCMTSRPLGFDKKGNILTYYAIGKLDARDIEKCVQMNDFVKHWMCYFEGIYMRVRKLHRQDPSKCVQLTSILNFDKLTLANATSKSALEQCMRVFRILQDNFPESLNAVYLINAPAYYVFVWSILKQTLSSAVIQKVHIYGFRGWHEKLLEVVDADVLPAFLGGNRTDPDGNPLCNTFVRHGGKMPEKYYLHEDDRDFTNKSLVKRITIPSKQKKEISIHVADTGLWIYWEFLIKHKDIGFGIFHKTSELELEEVLPVEKYDTVDGVEKGSYKSKSHGNYIIVFDNSYSWINSKEVHYCIIVLKSSS